MMQKEVAERIVAVHHTKEYGILSVQTQLMSTPEILFDVPPQVFSPPPSVESSVIRLTVDKPALACSDSHLKTVVRIDRKSTRLNSSHVAISSHIALPLHDALPISYRGRASHQRVWDSQCADTTDEYT